MWWSGKHDQHGGNIQVIIVSDGWPIWTSEVRPGCEHDTTAVGTHIELLPALSTAANRLRDMGERDNSLLKMTFRALRNVSLDPCRIGKIVAAVLVILHMDHPRTI